MGKQEALKQLSKHLMDCAMLMPQDWIQENGPGSEFFTAYEMAYALLEREAQRDVG